MKAIRTLSIEDLEDIFPSSIGVYKRICLHDFEIGLEALQYREENELNKDYENIGDIVLYLHRDFDRMKDSQMKGIHLICENGALVFNVASFDLDIQTDKEVHNLTQFEKIGNEWGYCGIGAGTTFENSEIGFFKSISKLISSLQDKGTDFSIKEEIIVAIEDLGIGKEFNAGELLEDVLYNEKMLDSITLSIYNTIDEKIQVGHHAYDEVQEVIARLS